MIKVAILGAGGMGRRHAANILKVGNAEVTAICSRTLASANRLNDSILAGKARCFDDFYTMLQQAQFDALYVCLPPFAHTGQIQKAAKAKKHLFVEKPLGLDGKEAMEMAALAKKNRIVSQMGFNMRFGGAALKLRSMIDDGSAGKPTLFHASFQCNALHAAWWRDAEKSGGQVVEQAIHLYDLATFFLGKPRTVSGLAGNLCHKQVNGFTSVDTSAAIIGFAGGAMASITTSDCAVPTRWRHSFTVVCEKVLAEFTDVNNAIFTCHDGKPAEAWSGREAPKPQEIKTTIDTCLEETRAFLDAIAHGGKPSADLAQGAATLNLVLAVMKSAKSGGTSIRL